MSRKKKEKERIEPSPVPTLLRDLAPTFSPIYAITPKVALSGFGVGVSCPGEVWSKDFRILFEIIYSIFYLAPNSGKAENTFFAIES